MDDDKQYWRENLSILKILLGIWFIVSFLGGIIFADELDNIRIGGFKLGFWIAQQGAIYVYVVLIFVYLKLMDRLDQRHRLPEMKDNEPSS